MRRLGFLAALILTLAACQQPVAQKWCDFTGERPAVAPKPVTGTWSFLRCYGDGRVERNLVCLAFGERGGAAAKPADTTLGSPLFLNWQSGRLVLRTCAPGDAECRGYTFTLEAIDAYSMYGTFTDGSLTGQARATLNAGQDCELDPNEPYIPEITPSPSLSPSASASPGASPTPSPSAR